MIKNEPQYPGLVLENTPILKSRHFFHERYEFFHRESSRACLAATLTLPLELAELRHAECFFSLLLREPFVRLEAYLVAGVYWQLGRAHKLDAAAIKILRHPSSLGGTHSKVLFLRLPALVNPAFALDKSDLPFCRRFQLMYQTLRHPLFHGYQLAVPIDLERIRQVMKDLRLIYAW